ncbi:MAG: AMP-binding protein [Clostridia bacterium]|nr:AMP-binding protein [Clostridia bacterium]
MKLCYSTNGWYGFDWVDLTSMATDLGYEGIEIHNLGSEEFSGRGKPFSKANLAETARNLRRQHIAIPCLDVMGDISDPAALKGNIAETKEMIDIASVLHTDFIRLRASFDGDKADETVLKLIEATVKEAAKNQVALLIETAGIYADTERLRTVLNAFACDEVAALWDFHHPFVEKGEDAETTITNLGAYIKHVHVKDSIEDENGSHYCLLGEGTMPLESMIRALRSVNYDGYYSFECTPDWLQDFGDGAIAFPHYLNYMRSFDESNKGENRLYDNKSHTGQYLWKKDILINKTFSQVLDRVVDEFPDQLAFKYTTLDYTRTYEEFREDVDTFARSLIALGVKPGDKVAIWASNVPQWFITFWATTKIGAVLVTVNTAYKIHEAEYLLRQSDTHTLVMMESCADAQFAQIIRELCPELQTTDPNEPLHCRRLPFLRHVISIDYKDKGCLSWDDALELANQVPKEEVFRRASAVSPDDVANMQYTSGTTGFPKGVMLTHYNIVNNGKCIGDRMDLSTADRMMVQVPMFHCFGMVLSMTASMTHAATLLPLPYFSPKPALACIHQEHITCFNGVPTMFIAMLRHEDFPKTDFSYIRTGIMAGSNCPPSLMREAVEKMNMTEITSVFGQTEASPGCTMGRGEDTLDVRVETVGPALPQIECKIINPETGEDLPDGEIGEFVARGYNIMKGYYKMPKATEAAIDADGWLHSGDLCCRTPEGNYRVTGRLKDMIIRGGENIYPREIEEFLFTNPKVKDVQVIGVPDEKYGEEIMAVIILQDGQTMTEEETKDFVRSHMARHKVPRYVDFVDKFPMNDAGKILKYKMRENAIEKLHLKV